MKLKTLLITLSLILVGFTHSTFGFYGVDLDKLRVIEDSSKNQDRDYNDSVFRYDSKILKQGDKVTNLLFNIKKEASGGKNWNSLNFQIPFNKTIEDDNFYNNLDSVCGDNPLCNQRISVDYLDESEGVKIHGKKRPIISPVANPTLLSGDKQAESVKLKFINGEWVEVRESVFGLIDDAGPTVESTTCGPENNACWLQGEPCSYSIPPDIYNCVCIGVYWNCKKQK